MELILNLLLLLSMAGLEFLLLLVSAPVILFGWKVR